MDEEVEAEVVAGTHRFRLPDDLYQIHVRLLDIDPPIWRRLIVHQDTPLPMLHRILQAAMGWSDSHLHQFKVGDVRFGEPDDDDFGTGPIDYAGIALNQVLPHRRSVLVYEYDFGDSWEHEIRLEEELPVDSLAGQVPRCLDGGRACPPEDAGGPPGYAQLVGELRDPHSPEHASSRAWASHRFDPEAFDVEQANKRLARLVRARVPRRARPGHGNRG